MSILTSPAGIFFINSDLSTQVKSVVERQFYITESITNQEFSERISVDENYPSIVKGSGYRILVICSFIEITNNELADAVLFFKNGLISIQKNNFGPPGKTFPLDRAYLSQLTVP